jgi:hypothetical protein
MSNNFLADIVYLLHLVGISFVTLGFMFVPLQYLKYYIIILISTMLLWYVWGNCYLTGLEHQLRTGQINNKPANEDGPEFFRPFMKKFFCLKLNRKEANKLNHIIYFIALLLGFIRYMRNTKLISVH